MVDDIGTGGIGLNTKYVSDFDTRQEMRGDDFEIFFRNDSASFGLAMHSHSFYELYCLLSGEVDIQVDGMRYALRPGNLLLIAPGLCVLIAAASEGLSRFKAGRAVNRALTFLGGLTFEIYLVHFWAVERPLPWVLPLTAVYAAALHGASLLVRRGMRLSS